MSLRGIWLLGCVLLLLLLCQPWAGGQQLPLRVTEVDGSPDGRTSWLRLPNGWLTLTREGQAKLTCVTASGSAAGCLSAADWSTFNAKVSSQWITSGSDIYYSTGNALLSATRPELQLLTSGSAKAHLAQFAAAGFHLTANLVFDGTNWNLDDTSLAGSVFSSGSGIFQWRNATAGANPRTLSESMRIDASGNVGVGATSPGSKLDVAGSFQADSITNDTGLAAGAYTPTLTNVANLDASTAYSCQYLRVGNTVTVSCKVDVDPTLAATSTQLGISLPVASNLSSAEQCAGAAFASGIASQGAAVLGDATNDRCQMQWVAGDVTNQPMFLTFSYKVQ